MNINLPNIERRMLYSLKDILKVEGIRGLYRGKNARHLDKEEDR